MARVPAWASVAATAALVLASAPASIAHGPVDSFDIALPDTTDGSAHLLVHWRILRSGGETTGIVVEDAAGADLFVISAAGNGDIVYFTNGTGPRHVFTSTKIDLGMVMTIDVGDGAYTVRRDDGPPFALATFPAGAPTRAWSGPGHIGNGGPTLMRYVAVEASHAPVVATTFAADPLPAPWTIVKDAPPSADVHEGNVVDGHHSRGVFDVRTGPGPGGFGFAATALPLHDGVYTAHASFRFTSVTQAAHRATLVAGISGASGLGEIRWAVTATGGTAGWDLHLEDGAVTGARLIASGLGSEWHDLDVAVDEAAGAVTVSLDGAVLVPATVPPGVAPGSPAGAARIAVGDVSDGILPGSGAGLANPLRFDNAWAFAR